jgi:serine/threonine protein kinase
LFGNPVAPPALPPFKERARYICLGIIKQAIEAVATLHEAGIAHRSIGRSSVIIGSVGLDKNEAVSPYSTNLGRIIVKLADFGFSGRFEESTRDAAFLRKARAFGLNFRENESSSATTGFAMAEDLNALGFVVLGLLLSTLAEVPTPEYSIPATDEDTLQRLLTDIFDKDMEQFRDYMEEEEIWTNLVNLLDEKDGWDFLESLLFARERAAEDGEIVTARGLLSSPFLQR